MMVLVPCGGLGSLVSIAMAHLATSSMIASTFSTARSAMGLGSGLDSRNRRRNRWHRGYFFCPVAFSLAWSGEGVKFWDLFLR
jgi:hypothetical protein